MSAEVVRLPPKERLVWVCGCGCQTWVLYNDGSVACSICNEAVDEDVGKGWTPPSPDKRLPEDFQSVFGYLGNGGFVEHRFKKDAAHPDVTWLMFGHDDGTVSAWRKDNFTHAHLTDEEADWLRGRIDLGWGMLK